MAVLFSTPGLIEQEFMVSYVYQEIFFNFTQNQIINFH